MKTHPCPRCGKETEGSYSKGGCLWAICVECMNIEEIEITKNCFLAAEIDVNPIPSSSYFGKLKT